MTVAVRMLAVATHPIQYHAPWYRALAARPDVELEVLFEHLPGPRAQGEGFGQAFRWDVPLLDGYAWTAGTLPGAPRSRIGALCALRRRLAAFRPRVALLTGWHSAVLLAAPTLAHRAGARCLVRGESNLLRPRPAWLHAGHRRLLARYDGFLAIGSANRAFYARHGIDGARVLDCPYFVDNERFEAAAAEAGSRRAALRRELGIPEQAVCFVFAGKLEAKKRVLDAIRALALVDDDAVHLLVVGSGPLEAEARSAARGLPVSFAGFLNQSRMAEAYVAGDCLVLPSDAGETWGLVVNEAMACARPAVVSDRAGCAADLVRPGRTGWVFPAGNVAALAGCLREAVQASAAGLADMGAAARAHLRAGFSVEGACEATARAARCLAHGARLAGSG